MAPVDFPVQNVIDPMADTNLNTATGSMGAPQNTANNSMINQNFLPNIPAGGLFTNLISGISNTFNPGSFWLAGEDTPGITGGNSQTPVNTNLPMEQPNVLPANTIVIPETPVNTVPKTVQKNVASEQDTLGRPISPVVVAPAVPKPQGSDLPVLQSSNIIEEKVPSDFGGMPLSPLGQEPGGVAIGVGAPVNLTPLGQPVKAPVPSVIRVGGRATTASPSPEEMIQQVQQPGQG